MASVVNSSLTLFDPSIIDETGNDITDADMLQGFSWRKGNVDFYTIDSLGMSVDVFWGEDVKLSPQAITAIQVPFEVVGAGGVGFVDIQLIDVRGIIPEGDPRAGSIGSNLLIPPGSYAVVFEQGFMPGWDRTDYYGEDPEVESSATSIWGRFWFNLQANAEPKILLPGSHDLKLCPIYLDPAYPLKMNAKPLWETVRIPS